MPVALPISATTHYPKLGGGRQIAECGVPRVDDVNCCWGRRDSPTTSITIRDLEMTAPIRLAARVVAVRSSVPVGLSMKEPQRVALQ